MNISVFYQVAIFIAVASIQTAGAWQQIAMRSRSLDGGNIELREQFDMKLKEAQKMLQERSLANEARITSGDSMIYVKSEPMKELQEAILPFVTAVLEYLLPILDKSANAEDLSASFVERTLQLLEDLNVAPGESFRGTPAGYEGMDRNDEDE